MDEDNGVHGCGVETNEGTLVGEIEFEWAREVG